MNRPLRAKRSISFRSVSASSRIAISNPGGRRRAMRDRATPPITTKFQPSHGASRRRSVCCWGAVNSEPNNPSGESPRLLERSAARRAHIRLACVPTCARTCELARNGAASAPRWAIEDSHRIVGYPRQSRAPRPESRSRLESSRFENSTTTALQTETEKAQTQQTGIARPIER